MSGGRPKKTVKDLPKQWYKEILAEYEKGASDVEIKAIIYKWLGSFSNDLWDRWLKEEPEFSETIKTGKLISEAWWHSNGRLNLKDKAFNYTGWYMQMKNRFGWKDRTDLTTKDKELPQGIDYNKLSTETLKDIANARNKS